jgi:hypothetical protein
MLREACTPAARLSEAAAHHSHARLSFAAPLLTPTGHRWRRAVWCCRAVPRRFVSSQPYSQAD